jgi:hypothetical protein
MTATQSSTSAGHITLSIDPAIKNNGYCIFYTSAQKVPRTELAANAVNTTNAPHKVLRNKLMHNLFGHIRLLDVGKFDLADGNACNASTSVLQFADGIKKCLDHVVARAELFATKCGLQKSDLRVLIETPHRRNFKLVKIYSNMAFYMKSMLKLNVKEITASAKSRFMAMLPFEECDTLEFSKPKSQYLKRKVKAVCALKLIVDECMPAEFVATDGAKKMLRDLRKTELRDIADAFVQYLTSIFPILMRRRSNA